MSDILFFVSIAFIVMIVLAVCAMIFSKNLLYVAYFLLIALFGLAGMYVLVGADFLAITQIVVYIGGVLILILFAIMFTHKTQAQGYFQKINQNLQPSSKSHHNFWGGIFTGILFLIFFYAIQQSSFSEVGWIQEAQHQKDIIAKSTVQDLGIHFMTNYLLPFEIIAILLLVALIGATLIAGFGQEGSD